MRGAVTLPRAYIANVFEEKGDLYNLLLLRPPSLYCGVRTETRGDSLKHLTTTEMLRATEAT